MTERIIEPAELAKVMRFDDAAQRLIWLPLKFHPQLTGKHPCRVVAQGYYSISIRRRRYREHRLIWALVHGQWPKGEIDHIDGDRKNNRLDNLRVVSRLENCRNAALRRDNTSGAPGVDWLEPNQKWRARICINGATQHIGLFNTIDGAKEARKKVEARLGFHPNHGRAPVMEAA